jgi:hypothetical protein
VKVVLPPPASKVAPIVSAPGAEALPQGAGADEEEE